MSYYGANVLAFLKMGASIADPLPAPGSDTFTDVPLLGSVTPPPNELTTAFFNVQNDGARRSVGGKLGDQVSEGNVVIDWTQTVHQNMYADSKVAGGRKRNWQIIYPDANGRQLDFVGFISAWSEEPFDAGEDAKEHRANFTLTIDGVITVTP